VQVMVLVLVIESCGQWADVVGVRAELPPLELGNRADWSLLELEQHPLAMGSQQR